MATIPNTRGNPQASDVAVQDALPMVGSASREDLQSTLGFVDAELAKLFEDRNIHLADGGLISFLGTTVQFTEPLQLHINSKIAGGSPVVIDLGDTTRTISADGRMIYAEINRTAGTAVVTDDAATLPAVTSAEQEIFLIAKRSDSGDGVKRLYFRNGTALDEGQTARLGSSGSGAGDANALLETIKNTLAESNYSLVTPYITVTDEDDLLDDPNSTAVFSLVDKTINFTGVQVAQTIQLADPNEFLNTTDALSEIDLLIFWRLSDIDTAATYEVSRNGGNEWQQVTMERVGNTDTYRGNHVFDEEASQQSLLSQLTNNASRDLNATTQQQISQAFTVASGDKYLIRQLVLNLTKTGTPDGNVYVSICEDDSGDPGDVLAETTAILANSLITGNNTINIPDIYLAAGTYHIKIRTDASYKATYSNGVKELSMSVNSSGSVPYARIYNGTAWSASSTDNLVYNLQGIEIDLRVKITSSMSSKLEGLGIFYDREPLGISTSELKKREVFHFSGSSNLNEFTITKFIVDPDLLRAYDINTGQVYAYGAFTLQGQTVVFEPGQFNYPGESLTLVFDQSVGGSFDNSDLNALLLANNHLGSTDNTVDKSVDGRGIFLRRPDGTLREIAIDDSDNIVIYSV